MKLLFDREEEFDRLLTKLHSLEPGSKEYQSILEQLNTLVRIDSYIYKEEESKASKLLSNPALVGVLGNLAMTLLVLNYERLGVVTSRAFSFIRPR